MTIKKDWMVCDMENTPLYDEDLGEPETFSTEKAAIKRAKEHVQTSQDSEAWVYCLSHVVSRPDTEPVVEAVK
jgi:hypothetical protein